MGLGVCTLRNRLVLGCLLGAAVATPQTPNLVVIVADDLEYGDVGYLNAQSLIRTPNLDALARQGMAFLDGHTPSSVCTPTRYGLLPGRYAWRTRLKRGVLNGYGEPLLAPGRETLGSLLGTNGYRTAAIGKWHLGLGIAKSTWGEFSNSTSRLTTGSTRTDSTSPPASRLPWTAPRRSITVTAGSPDFL